MTLTLGARRSGKTLAAIRHAAATGAYLIVPTRQRAEEAVATAREIGLDIHFPITFDDFINRTYYGRGITGFVIDNADLLLNTMSPGVPIVGATWSAHVGRPGDPI